jgi:hypothetical protein
VARISEFILWCNGANKFAVVVQLGEVVRASVSDLSFCSTGSVSDLKLTSNNTLGKPRSLTLPVLHQFYVRVYCNSCLSSLSHYPFVNTIISYTFDLVSDRYNLTSLTYFS